MEPPQPACTGGCPIKTAVTCVTDKHLAQALPSSNVRVTTQRSAVVTRTYSGPKCAAWRIFLNTRPNAAKIMVSLSKYFCAFGNDNSPWLVYTPRTQSVLSVAAACTVATKAPPDRVTVHRRKPRSIFQIRTTHSVCSIYQASACLSHHELCARRLPLAIVLSRSFFTNRRIFLLTSKEVFRHTQRTPVLGHVGLRRAIPQLRKACVAFDQASSGRLGVVSHDRSAQADLSAAAAR